MRVRLIGAITLLALGACNVENDTANDQVRVNYDQQRIEKAAGDTERAAGAVATGAANVARDTARAVKREVGDIDVDVKVTRDRAATRDTEPAN